MKENHGRTPKATPQVHQRKDLPEETRSAAVGTMCSDAPWQLCRDAVLGLEAELQRGGVPNRYPDRAPLTPRSVTEPPRVCRSRNSVTHGSITGVRKRLSRLRSPDATTSYAGT